jgi:hypothetical protein
MKGETTLTPVSAKGRGGGGGKGAGKDNRTYVQKTKITDVSVDEGGRRVGSPLSIIYSELPLVLPAQTHFFINVTMFTISEFH